MTRFSGQFDIGGYSDSLGIDREPDVHGVAGQQRLQAEVVVLVMDFAVFGDVDAGAEAVSAAGSHMEPAVHGVDAFNPALDKPVPCQACDGFGGGDDHGVPLSLACWLDKRTTGTVRAWFRSFVPAVVPFTT